MGRGAPPHAPAYNYTSDRTVHSNPLDEHEKPPLQARNDIDVLLRAERKSHERTIQIPPVLVTVEWEEERPHMPPHITIRLIGQSIPIRSMSMKNHRCRLVTTSMSFCEQKGRAMNARYRFPQCL